MPLLKSVLLTALLVAAVPVLAQQAVPALPADAPTHEVAQKELRELRDAAVEALNGGDIVGLLGYLETDFLFTAPNGDTVRGHRGVRDYFSTKMIGAKRSIVDLQITVQPDSLDIIADDESYAIAYGTCHVRCQLEDANTLNLDGRWTAVMTHKQGKWMLASVHYSGSIFANAVLSSTRTNSVWLGLGSTVFALLGGLWLGRWLEQYRLRIEAEQSAKDAAAAGGLPTPMEADASAAEAARDEFN